LIKNLIHSRPIIFIITGKTGSGKTTFVARLIKRLRKHNLTISGFLAVRSGSDKQRHLYEIFMLDTGKTMPLASGESVKDWIKMANFYFNPEAILYGNSMLNDPQILSKDLIVIDEIGIFELDGQIWADSISRLSSKSDSRMIWVVRDTLIEKVLQKWNLTDAVIFDIKKVSVRQAEKRILSVF
jgi:nucleoside-triphosphatase THEP1